MTLAAEKRDNNAALEAALSYARRGWAVLPVHSVRGDRCTCGSAACSSAGKHPRTKRGVSDATTDEAPIRKWWASWPDANVAIATGERSGFVAIDIDPRNGGDRSLERLRDAHGELLPTVRAATGGGGEHILFRSPERAIRNHNSGSVFGPGIDVKGDGGYIVVAPSRHASGNSYMWRDGASPADIQVAAMPDWMIERLCDFGVQPPMSSGRLILEGGRNNELTRIGGAMRARGSEQPEIAAALQAANRTRCVPPLPAEEVAHIAHSVSRYERNVTTMATANPISGAFHLTDLGNAQRLVRDHGRHLRHCHAERRWFIWDGRRWVTDDTGELARRAKQSVSAMYAEATGIDDVEGRRAVAKHAAKSESERSIKAMIALATSEPSIPVTLKQLDADPWLLNALNGTIDLRTGILRPHAPEDLITKLAPAEYNPATRSHIWEEFLARALPDPAVRRFVQKAVGYTLVGTGGEDVLFVLHGPTRTGKGTFQDAIAAALGDYATTAELDLLSERDRADASRARPELVRLHGTRMVSAYETSRRLKLSSSLIKTLAGNDPITARPLYGNPITFRPGFTIWVATNFRPGAPAGDDAFWQRIREIPFVTQIPEAERRPDVRSALREAAAERAAVLAWAVAGALMWQSEGLGTPPAVTRANAEYRAEMDPVQRFVDEQCVLTPGAWTRTSELYAACTAWAKKHSEPVPLQSDFTESLKRQGCKPYHRNQGRGWTGIRLRDTPHDGMSDHDAGPHSSRHTSTHSNDFPPGADMGRHGVMRSA